MSGSENVYGYICYRPLNTSYQSLNVGLWPKIEEFCHSHAKLMVIFLKYLLLAVTQQCIDFSYSHYTHSSVMCLINIQ